MPYIRNILSTSDRSRHVNATVVGSIKTRSYFHFLAPATRQRAALSFASQSVFKKMDTNWETILIVSSLCLLTNSIMAR